MTQLTIRPLADGDEAAVIALWQACGLTRPWNDPARDLAFARGKPNSDILVGLAESRIVASAMVGHDGHRGTMYYVSVAPSEQGPRLRPLRWSRPRKHGLRSAGSGKQTCSCAPRTPPSWASTTASATCRDDRADRQMARPEQARRPLTRAPAFPEMREAHRPGYQG